MSALQQVLFGGGGGIVRGCQTYTTPGTYTWTAPAGVTKVSVVAVGGGSRAGGGLAYKNNISVTPGSSYTVVVGAPGNSGSPGTNSGASYFSGLCVVRGGGTTGSGNTGGTFVGDGGGAGGIATGNTHGSGSGAGGYSGTGGTGASSSCAGLNGSGGSGGGGGGLYTKCHTAGSTFWVGVGGGGGGGGVGLLGSGASGTGGSAGFSGAAGSANFTSSGAAGGSGGSGGSAGSAGGTTFVGTCSGSAGSGGGGGLYGGGAGGQGRAVKLQCCSIQYCSFPGQTPGANGAVRIVWPGCARSFPSTDVA